MKLINVKNVKTFRKKFEYKNCDQGVHDHDVLVDLVHISENGKMQISPKLEVYGAKEVNIRNQRPRLRRNSLFLGRKAGGGCKGVPNLYISSLSGHVSLCHYSL